MAEGFLRKYGSDKFNAYSAGTEPAERVHPLAVQVMAEKGIDETKERRRIPWQVARASPDYCLLRCE